MTPQVKWNKANRDKMREATARWRANNLNKARATCRAWKKNNPAKHAALQMKRKAAQLNRTPSWADHGKIAELYNEAQRLFEETGIVYHVDHIIPLQGETVSGLHVENNLQVIPAEENIKKSNKFEEMYQFIPTILNNDGEINKWLNN